MTDDRARTGLPFTTFDFFQAVADIDRETLPENQPQLRPKPRASSLLSDARVIGYSMANVPYSDPHREDPDKVFNGYAQATGRMVETINHAAIERVLPAGWAFLPTPMCIGHEACKNKTSDGARVDHWSTGHPDDVVVRPDGKLVLVSYKYWTGFGYMTINKEGLYTRRDSKGAFSKGSELLAQEAVYGSGLVEDPAEVWWCIIAADAGSSKRDFRQKAFAGKDPHVKGFLRGVEWDQVEVCVPSLQRRAEWFTEWFATDGDPTHIKLEHKPPPKNWREQPPAEIFPWGYTEYESLVLSDPEGYLVAPKPLPW